MRLELIWSILVRMLVAVILITAAPAPQNVMAEDNPFTGRAADEAPVVRVDGPLAVVGRAFLAFQRESNRLIGSHMRAIRDGETSEPLLIGMALAFLYGVIHALGPGHGKLVVISYFLAREARIGKGLAMGLQIAAFHVISAIVIVALADILLRTTLGGPPGEVPGVRLFSYGLIALIGAGMLVQAVRRQRLRQAGIEIRAACCGGLHHAHDRHDHRHEHGGGASAGAERGLLSLGVGLVPCTGAVLILLYALANGILVAGIVLASMIALGMALTMGLLGMIAVIARQAVAARLEAGGDEGRLSMAADYAGAVLITTIGVGLLWAAWISG